MPLTCFIQCLGFLCLFGQVECLFHILPNTNDDDKPSKMSHGSRCLINKGFRPVVSHHEEQKTASRLANKHEQTQPSFMRTLSDYHSFGEISEICNGTSVFSHSVYAGKGIARSTSREQPFFYYLQRTKNNRARVRHPPSSFFHHA